MALINRNRRWFLDFYPNGDYSIPRPFKIQPGAKEKFVSRFTQECEPIKLTVFNIQEFVIIPDFEMNKNMPWATE